MMRLIRSNRIERYFLQSVFLEYCRKELFSLFCIVGGTLIPMFLLIKKIREMIEKQVHGQNVDIRSVELIIMFYLILNFIPHLNAFFCGFMQEMKAATLPKKYVTRELQ